jgi:hypothetical protein
MRYRVFLEFTNHAPRKLRRAIRAAHAPDTVMYDIPVYNDGCLHVRRNEGGYYLPGEGEPPQSVTLPDGVSARSWELIVSDPQYVSLSGNTYEGNYSIAYIASGGVLNVKAVDRSDAVDLLNRIRSLALQSAGQ